MKYKIFLYALILLLLTFGCQENVDTKTNKNSANYAARIFEYMSEIYKDNIDLNYFLNNYQIAKLIGNKISVSNFRDYEFFEKAEIKKHIFKTYSEITEIYLLTENNSQLKEKIAIFTQKVKELENNELTEKCKELDKFIDNYKFDNKKAYSYITQITYSIWQSDYSQKSQKLDRMYKEFVVAIDTAADSMFDADKISKVVQEPCLNDHLMIQIYKKDLKDKVNNSKTTFSNQFAVLDTIFSQYKSLIIKSEKPEMIESTLSKDILILDNLFLKNE